MIFAQSASFLFSFSNYNEAICKFVLMDIVCFDVHTCDSHPIRHYPFIERYLEHGFWKIAILSSGWKLRQCWITDRKLLSLRVALSTVGVTPWNRFMVDVSTAQRALMKMHISRMLMDHCKWPGLYSSDLFN